MNLKTFLNVIYRKLWLIILIPIISTGVTILICTFAVKPIYESTVTFYVVNKNTGNDASIGSYDSVMVDQQLMLDYKEIIKSNTITNSVLEKLKIADLSIDDMNKKVNVLLKNDSRILVLYARDTDPQLAKDLAETYGNVFIEKVQTLMTSDNIRILDIAELPTKPIAPNTLLSTLIMAAIGLMSGCTIAFFIEYFDDTIRTAEDVELYMNTPVIGAIPDFTTLNRTTQNAYETLKTNIQLYNFGKNIKSLAVTGYSSGDGKTTTAYNLACTFAHSGSTVLYVDADMHKPEILKELKGENFKGLSHVLLGKLTLNDVINSSDISGLDYVIGGIMPINPLSLLNSANFNEFLTNTCKLYDIVIVDTPPLGSVIDSIAISAQTDATIFVLKPGKVSIKHSQQVIKQLKNIKMQLLGVVINKISKYDYRNYFGEYDYYNDKKRKANKVLRKNKKYTGWIIND